MARVMVHGRKFCESQVSGVFIWLQNVRFLTYDGDLHLQMLNMSQWQTGAMLTVCFVNTDNNHSQ